MKTKVKIIAILIYCMCNNLHVVAQGNFIYGIHMLPSPYSNAFARYDTTTGSLTNLQTIQGISGLASIWSSCTNAASNTYYFCSGKRVVGFEMTNGNIVLDQTLQLSSNANFYNIQFNQCNGLFYGLLSTSSNVSFASYDLTTGIINTLLPNLGIGLYFGGTSFIDYANSRYVSEFSNNVIGINLYTGQMDFNTPIVNLPGELFHHLVYKCSNKTIYGTSLNTSMSVKYLSVFDTSSGNVIHVSNTGWNLGISKWTSSGFTMEQADGIYYYVGSPGSNILGINSVNGNLVHSKNLNLPTGEGFFLIQKPGCTCSTIGINEAELRNDEINFYPNPFTDILYFTSNNKASTEITLYDITSKRLIHQEFISSTSINTAQLAKGIYIYELSNKNGLIEKGKIIKQ